jgi:hypothetical protein
MSGGSPTIRLGRHAAVLVTFVLIAPGCGRQVGSFLGPNQPPEIEIVDARGGRDPSAGVRVRWAARDPEGRLAATHWSLAPWVTGARDAVEEHTTTLEECVLPADRLATTRAIGAAREPQRFAVWAVDAEGSRSETATLAIFQNNVAPIVAITAPQPSSLLNAQVGPTVCIQWTGTDPDGVFTQKPVKYKFEVLDLDDPSNTVFLVNPDSLRRVAVATNWAGWDSTSADTEHTVLTNLVPGKSYLFTVTGWDEAGDYDPVFSLNKNMLRFAVGFPGSLGPRMTVTGPAFSYAFQSGGWSLDPARVIHTEVAANAPIAFQWSAIAAPGQAVTGYRWVLDPVDVFDDTPRSGPGDLRHWSDLGPGTSVSIGPFSIAGPKREEHTLYIEGRSNASPCSPSGSDFKSLAIVHLVVVKPTLDKELLIVDDTRLEVDKFIGACPGNYTQKWPSAAELDTFLYARGGVTWRCTKNPTTGVISTPGLFAGYEFDTTGTRAVISGRMQTGGDQAQAIPLSVLAGYRHVLWLTDGVAATLSGDPFGPVNTATTAMRFMSNPGLVNVLVTYVKMGGKLWLAGGGTATASLLPWDKFGNNGGGVTRFSSAPPWNEILPSQLVWEGPHLRSEISVVANAVQATRALGRFEPAPGAYGALPLTLDSRTTLTDPLPPTRTVPSLFYTTTRQAEFLTQPNLILEGGESVLDSLYVVQGGGVPIGTGNVAMTVYHGADGGECVWTGFDLWSFQRSECIQLVDGVLQGIWGLPRAPVARGPAGAPALSVDGSRAPHGFARMTRALRVHY